MREPRKVEYTAVYDPYVFSYDFEKKGVGWLLSFQTVTGDYGDDYGSSRVVAVIETSEGELITSSISHVKFIDRSE